MLDVVTNEVAKQPDLDDLFDENEWDWFSVETRQQLRIFPSHLAYSEEEAAFAIILLPSKGGDFAFG